MDAMGTDDAQDRIATVTHVHARTCSAVPEGETEEQTCILSGKLYDDLEKETKPVAVGDRVRLASDGENLAVVEVLPRRNALSRPSVIKDKVYQVIAANVDRMLVVASVRQPKLKPGLIDRFLVAAGVEQMSGVVCLNKIDLTESDKDRDLVTACRSAYEAAGYAVFPTCATSGEGVRKLGEALTEGITLIVGHSGVGKSTLLNAMDPRLELATGDISRKWKTGQHTTTSVRLLRLDGGGYFIDTPGIREFGIASIDPHHLGHYFPEIAAVSRGCRFPDCTHDHEPDCAVREAVESGGIPRFRYESYLRILKSL